jgi:hypothetical protein
MRRMRRIVTDFLLSFCKELKNQRKSVTSVPSMVKTMFYAKAQTKPPIKAKVTTQ